MNVIEIHPNWIEALDRRTTIDEYQSVFIYDRSFVLLDHPKGWISFERFSKTHFLLFKDSSLMNWINLLPSSSVSPSVFQLFTVFSILGFLNFIELVKTDEPAAECTSVIRLRRSKTNRSNRRNIWTIMFEDNEK